MHIQDRDQCNWLRERIETQRTEPYSKERRRCCWTGWRGRTCSRTSEQQVRRRKRFGLEGCETLIPGFKEAIDKASELGVESLTIGMPHRGR